MMLGAVGGEVMKEEGLITEEDFERKKKRY